MELLFNLLCDLFLLILVLAHQDAVEQRNKFVVEMIDDPTGGSKVGACTETMFHMEVREPIVGSVLLLSTSLDHPEGEDTVLWAKCWVHTKRSGHVDRVQLSAGLFRVPWLSVCTQTWTLHEQKDLRALSGFENRVTGKEAWSWLVVFQKLIADIAFIYTVCCFIFFICQCWHLAQRIELQKPIWLLIKLIPQASLGVLDGYLVQRIFNAFLIEGNPDALCKRAKPARSIGVGHCLSQLQSMFTRCLCRDAGCA